MKKPLQKQSSTDRLELLHRLGFDKFAASLEEVQAAKIRQVPLSGSSLQVWLVDGALVRDAFTVEFIGGGHHYVYPWIPKDEIWLEESLTHDDRVVFLIHELYERSLMAQGVSYGKAHDEANVIERHVRDNPKDIPKILALVTALNEQPPKKGVKPGKGAEEKKE